MIRQRSFESYDTYVYAQGAKARGRREFLLAHLPKNIANFRVIFDRARPKLKKGSILCLGARTGAESLAAVEAGFPGSVGIDLHPVGPTVIQADWHALPFARGTFANAYCNSIDHCLYLDRFASEVQRVLVPDGRFYLMATNRHMITVKKWIAKPGNEALSWESANELSEALCRLGFVVRDAWQTGKWGHYIFGVSR